MNTLTDFNPDTDFAEVACSGCARLFEAKLFRVGNRSLHVKLCPRCAEADVAEKERLRNAEREHAWLSICPAAYRKCDHDKLPSDESRKAHDFAMGWQPTMGGLSLVGRESGQGKTRIAHAAAHRHFVDGTSVASVNCSALALEITARFDREVRDVLKPYRKVGILILDDLGKERSNPRVDGALYHLVEYRTSTGRPIVFTANYTGDELAERLGEHGPYIVRRLREYCRGCIL